MLHTVPAGQVILVLDTSNSDTIDPDLLETHATNLDARPEALVTSAGAGQMANYSADRTIALFAKHLAASLSATEGTLADVIRAASAGTRQAAIPICVALREKQSDSQTNEKDCTQVPEVHDPAGILSTIAAFSERLSLSEARLHLMLNEGASADSLKKTVTALANTLGPEDRLIIYANIPSISNTAAEADLPSGQ
ncbi:Uncharacterized protein SCF082_LOCUS31782, partial [Durusdinium trenchii]